MTPAEEVVVLGGTAGIGFGIADAYVQRGASVAIVSRSAERAERAAALLGARGRAITADVSRPDSLEADLASLEAVSRLVLTAVPPHSNTIDAFDVGSAREVTNVKILGYSATIAALRKRFAPGASILMFGGNSRDKPYPGSTTLTAVNGAVAHLARSLAIEVAPIRVNGIHPGVVVDTPTWSDAPDEFIDSVRAATPTGQLVTIAEVVDAAVFLLENPAVTGQNLNVDGGSGL